jgi:hypothetical protein
VRRFFRTRAEIFARTCGDFHAHVRRFSRARAEIFARTCGDFRAHVRRFSRARAEIFARTCGDFAGDAPSCAFGLQGVIHIKVLRTLLPKGVRVK